MLEAIFDEGISKLQRAFRVKLHPETARIYKDRLLVFSEIDWFQAVDHLIDEGEGFPKVATLKKLLVKIAVDRREGDQKDRAVEASKRDPEKPTSIGKVLEKFPFPAELKNALQDKISGKINQAQLEETCNKWGKENVEAKPCSCDDRGLIFYEQDGYSYVGKCVKHGMSGPKSYPAIDPQTMLVVR